MGIAKIDIFFLLFSVRADHEFALNLSDIDVSSPFLCHNLLQHDETRSLAWCQVDVNMAFVEVMIGRRRSCCAPQWFRILVLRKLQAIQYCKILT